MSSAASRDSMDMYRAVALACANQYCVHYRERESCISAHERRRLLDGSLAVSLSLRMWQPHPKLCYRLSPNDRPSWPSPSLTFFNGLADSLVQL